MVGTSGHTLLLCSLQHNVLGPGCSSLGVGAMVENGPFGVKPDGKTLYSRRFAWNKGLVTISHFSD